MVYNINSDNEYNPDQYYQKLSNKIGRDVFETWNKEYSTENLTAILTKIADETVAKHDTHRYSDETVDCFLKATIASDPAEATSICQYALHQIDINGVVAQHGGEL